MATSNPHYTRAITAIKKSVSRELTTAKGKKSKATRGSADHARLAAAIKGLQKVKSIVQDDCCQVPPGSND